MRLETLLSPLSVPVVTWRWSRLSSTSMLIQIVSVYQCCYVVDSSLPQSQSTKLVTPHSLWHIKKDIWRLSNILLKNISVTQTVCAANRYLFSVQNLLVSTVAVNKAGDTPLSLECSWGYLEMVKALINKHVDPNSKCLSVLLRC